MTSTATTTRRHGTGETYKQDFVGRTLALHVRRDTNWPSTVAYQEADDLQGIDPLRFPIAGTCTATEGTDVYQTDFSKRKSGQTPI